MGLDCVQLKEVRLSTTDKQCTFQSKDPFQRTQHVLNNYKGVVQQWRVMKPWRLVLLLPTGVSALLDYLQLPLWASVVQYFTAKSSVAAKMAAKNMTLSCREISKKVKLPGTHKATNESKDKSLRATNSCMMADGFKYCLIVTVVSKSLFQM